MEGKIHAVYGGPGGSNTNEKENMNRKKKKKRKLAQCFSPWRRIKTGKLLAGQTDITQGCQVAILLAS